MADWLSKFGNINLGVGKIDSLTLNQEFIVINNEDIAIENIRAYIYEDKASNHAHSNDFLNPNFIWALLKKSILMLIGATGHLIPLPIRTNSYITQIFN